MGGRLIVFGGIALFAIGYLFGNDSSPPKVSPPKAQAALDFSSAGIPVAARAPKEKVETPAPKIEPSRTPPPQKKPENRNAEIAAEAARIALLIVQASRDSYYATGRPCACPDDRMRNGRRCGGNSAYSKPGGRQPLCYVSDVTAEHIERYRLKAKRSSVVR